MPSLGPLEILVVLVVALLVFGPNKLPDLSRQIGRAMREFRRVQAEFEDHVRTAFDDGEPSIMPVPPPMAPMPETPSLTAPSTSLIQPGAVPLPDRTANAAHEPADHPDHPDHPDHNNPDPGPGPGESDSTGS